MGSEMCIRDRYIPIEKNNIKNDTIEYSTKFNLNGCYFYISGIIDEDNFVKIIENLYY